MVPNHLILLNRLATKLLRGFPWPMRWKFQRFPPIATETDPTCPILIVMGTPDRVPESIWAAYTCLHWHPIALRLVLAFDGPIYSRAARKIHKVFPQAEILNAKLPAERLRDYPGLGPFCAFNRFGRKLAVIGELNQSSSLVYMDSDILFYGQSKALMEQSASAGLTRTMITVAPGSDYTTVGPVVEIAASQGIIVPRSMNSGFFLAPPESFDLKWLDSTLLEALTAGQKSNASVADAWDFFTEQHLVGASLARGAYDVLPADSFINSNEGMLIFRPDQTVYDGIVMRHFFGNVRHRMYMTGMPLAYSRMFHR